MPFWKKVKTKFSFWRLMLYMLGVSLSFPHKLEKGMANEFPLNRRLWSLFLGKKKCLPWIQRLGELTKIVQEASSFKRSPEREKFLICIGAHEFYSSEVWKEALTELFATASLMFSLTNSIIACLDSQEIDPKLLVPLAVFNFLVVMVPLSGGHMSPVLTYIVILRGVITLTRTSIYVIAQCIDSIIGFLIIKSVMNQKTVEKFSLGSCTIASSGRASGIDTVMTLVLEFSYTFLVLFIGVTVAFDKKRSKQLGLVMVCVVVAASMGLAVFVSITVTGQARYAGVDLNPASLGPIFLEGGQLWAGHWVFWVGPFLACSFYYAFSVNLPKKEFDWVDGEYNVLNLAGTCFGEEAILLIVKAKLKKTFEILNVNQFLVSMQVLYKKAS